MNFEKYDFLKCRSQEKGVRLRIVYSDDNLPIKYIEGITLNSLTHFFFRYGNGSNNEKIRYIDKKQDFGRIETIEEIRLYNDHEYLTKKKRKTDAQYPDDQIADINTEMRNLTDGKLTLNRKHSEEYDYIDYKYDKSGNCIEHKIYLNWDEKGSNFHAKIKRKIEYW